MPWQNCWGISDLTGQHADDCCQATPAGCQGVDRIVNAEYQATTSHSAPRPEPCIWFKYNKFGGGIPSQVACEGLTLFWKLRPKAFFSEKTSWPSFPRIRDRSFKRTGPVEAHVTDACIQQPSCSTLQCTLPAAFTRSWNSTNKKNGWSISKGHNLRP